MNKKKYTKPVIYKNGNDWFVYFEYFNEATGKYQPFKKREGLNRIKNLQEKESEFKALRKAREEWLKSGWNPITNSFNSDKEPDESTNIDLLRAMTLNKALDYSLAQCSVSKATYRGYAGIIRFFQKAANELGIGNLPIQDIKRHYIRSVIRKIKADRKWSNKAYNKSLGYLSAVFTPLVEAEIIEYNPASDIKRLPTVETVKYEPLTEDEKRKILQYLYFNHYRYLAYLMVIYHTGIRCKEVLLLKIKDVDLRSRTIKIIPDLDEENSKVKRIRYVPINDHLLPFFREMRLSELPSHYYVFGSPWNRTSGGNLETGKGSMNVNYLKPSPYKVKRDSVTRLWKKIVRDKLKINKYQYAMKHTGADDKILAGVTLDALKELYGHSSKLMTEKYARKVKEVYRKEITEKSPSFLPKRVNKTEI